MKTKPTPDWEKRKIGDAGDIAKEHFTKGEIYFIHQVEQEARKEVVEEVELMRIKTPDCESGCRYEGSEEYDHGWEMGYNQALSDLLTKLKIREKK